MPGAFDDPGIFWIPEIYRKAERVKKDEVPKLLPPIPDTGWAPKEFFPDLSAAKVIGFDTETCDPDLRDKGPGCRRGAHIVGVSIATDEFAVYYPLAHTIGENIDKGKVIRYLQHELSRPQQAKVGANLLYDLDFLSYEGVNVAGPIFDVQYADPLLDEYAMSYSLDSIAKRRLPGESKDTALLYQWCADAYGGEPDEKQRDNIWRAPTQLVGPYAEQDARLPLRIIRKQWELLQEKGLISIFHMECGLIPLLLQLRQQGVRIDLDYTNSLIALLNEEIETLKKEVGINVYAATDLAALCDAEGIEYPRTQPSAKHPEGQPSFVKKWLLEHPHPVLRKVSLLRQRYKLRDTFLTNALLGNHIEGFVHCEFNPLRSDDYGTVSGRFSSSHPNLQQIPIRDKVWGPKVRACFIPHEEDLAWMKVDLSQIEYRLGVHYGVGRGIEEVRHAYRTDPKMDFYTLAMKFTGLERDPTKSISLGTLYGMREKKFALMTGRTLAESRELFAQFNARLPFMRATYEHFSEEALREGYVRTIGGRICTLVPDYAHKALNRKLQGSCADWIKRAMLTAYRSGLFNVLRLYLTVHDELDVGVSVTKEGVEAAKELHQVMVHTYPLCIPVQAGIDLGRNWGALQDCEPQQLTLDRLALTVKKGEAS